MLVGKKLRIKTDKWDHPSHTPDTHTLSVTPVRRIAGFCNAVNKKAKTGPVKRSG